MSDKKLLPQQFALECFDYIDGDIFWRDRPIHHFASEWHQRVFNSRQAGSRAGTAYGEFANGR